MQRKRYFYILTVSFLLIAIITSCSPAPVSTPEVIEMTKIVEQTVIVTQIVTELVIVTATPEPATPTPEATPTSVYQKWTSQQVVNALKSAGLEAESTSVMTKDDYGLAPLVAVEGTHFLIPSLCSDCGGRIFSYSNPDDLGLTEIIL